MNMLRKHVLVFLTGSLALMALVSGCSGQSGSSSTTAGTTTTNTSGSMTFAQLAESGKTVFASRCANCHGDQGQGVTAPGLIGANANLGKYGTAEGLLNFIDTSMPLDAPGKLSHQEYLQMLCFLLVQNNYASGSTIFDENALGNVQLK